MKNLARQHATLEHSRGVQDFLSIVRWYGAAKGDPIAAAYMAKSAEAPDRVVQSLGIVGKSAVSAASTTDATDAAPLAGFQQASGAWVESLRNTNVFDSVFPFMRRAPLHTHFAISTAGATGAQINEAAARTISNLALEGHYLTEHKPMAAVVVTAELLRIGGPDVLAMLNAEMVLAMAAVCDFAFLGYITTGLTPIASQGSTVTAARTDMGLALAAMDLSAKSKVFVICEPGTMKALALSCEDSGAPAFEDIGILGGTYAGMTYLVSDSLTPGQMVFVDANQLVANAGTVELSTIRQASIQMVDSGPDSPVTANTTVVSLWQRGLVALALQRYLGCERVRSTAAAVISGAHYQGDSP